MSLRFLLWLVAGILMGISAFVNSPRISLSTLAWSLFILGWTFSGEVEAG